MKWRIIQKSGKFYFGTYHTEQDKNYISEFDR